MRRTWRWAGILLAAGAATAAAACGDEDPAKPAGGSAVDPQEIPKGDAGKRMYFEKRCKEGHIGMCGELGLMWEKGWGGAKDKAKADVYYKQACDFGVFESCKALGVELKPAEELERLQANCAKGSAFACNNAGALLLGADQLVPADPAKALPALEKGCAGGFAASCRGLARMYGKGIGVTVDEGKAKEYAAKADAAAAAVDALEAEYFHRPPRDELPVGRPSKAFFDSMKGDKADQDALNQKVLDDAAKKAGVAPTAPAPAPAPAPKP
jgi:hypothetical protein